MTPRFLQIHTLTSYTAALLNRDDAGLAKRLRYGDAVRTRISSQCLKRHWRIAEDPHALSELAGFVDSKRSRELVTKEVIGPLRKAGIDEAVAARLDAAFQKAVYGDKGESRKSRQTLLLGQPELDWLAAEAARLAGEAGGDAKTADALAAEWAKSFKANIAAMREGAALPGGLAAALFGRMLTSDPEANIEAPVHVAHAFTVHEEEAEADYFTAVDDLAADEPGADTIQETEVTSGLFYGYVVVDLEGLMSNLGGERGRSSPEARAAAADLAGRVLHNLAHLVAEVSPGAKRGSTAPYGRAGLMLLEAGDRQPRSLAEAFRDPVAPRLPAAAEALAAHLGALDATYATGEGRHALSLANTPVPGAAHGTLADLAAFARSLPGRLG